MTRPRDEVRAVLALAEAGTNASEIAQRTGLPRSTIRGWIASSPFERPPSKTVVHCPICNDAAPRLDEAAYAYLFGLYLGDGTISKQPKNVWRLRISQDQRYTRLIEECKVAMHAVLPNNVLVQQREGCVEIGSSSKHWPCLFPQAGPGRKHERLIALASWQLALVEAHNALFLKGLIESDGCRDSNRVKVAGTYREYPRYTFSNASSDIRGIFTDTCDRLGVHWTRMSERIIAIARRADVAFLDTFIGPKS
jgi:hypothetical protein